MPEVAGDEDKTVAEEEDEDEDTPHARHEDGHVQGN